MRQAILALWARMMASQPGIWQAIQAAQVQWQGKTPFATGYQDSYFSVDQGPAECQHVFLQGNHLPLRFAALRAGELFSIGETGFGCGLNLLLAAQLFLQLAPPGAQLQLLSTEMHPLHKADLLQALQHWRTELRQDLIDALLDQYPAPTAGFHRVQLAESIQLTLCLGDAMSMLKQCTTADHQLIDAWFLDGFAPARNPAMWSPQLFAEVARCSRPGATLASYSVAGIVQRGLQAVGFQTSKQPGFGRKRECLQALWPGPSQPSKLRRGHAIIAGAGLAGATTARALAERGWQVQVCDPDGIATGASGNRVGVVYTTPGANLSAQNRFYLSSFVHALCWLQRYQAETLGIAHLPGVVQHLAHARQRNKLQQALSSGIWPEQLLTQLDAHRFQLHGAGWLHPRAWCQHLLEHPAIRLCRATVCSWKAGAPVAIQLQTDEQRTADALILCTGAATPQFAGLQHLPLQVVRGQVTEVAATGASRRWQQVQCHAGYLTPAIDDRHSLGASYRSAQLTGASSVEDDQQNLLKLREQLPDYWQALGGDRIRVIAARAGLRVRSPDYLPLLGALPGQPGVYLNTAHGSRGISSTPLCADALADQLSGLLPAMDVCLQNALVVGRFA
ncbi:MAG: FAD-dependent 5-carboxymethylaminomethyl-2-thiouridine(34) oxidoreductase MnmC [Gammaproteobacteria bacterium]|nr:FAD-dependent 5-carboxymethylaminomethyl-2-thiouridine(34) oxidoreductase MnmC [Gammaproteobacteria bacterium]